MEYAVSALEDSADVTDHPQCLRKIKRRVGDAILNVAIVLVLLLALAAWRLPIFSHGLYILRSAYDFGTINAGDPVEHSFTVRNLHPWTVTITGIHAGCGCTRGFVKRKPPFELKPFQAVTVYAAVTTLGKKGPVQEVISVYTEDNRDGTPFLFRGYVK